MEPDHDSNERITPHGTTPSQPKSPGKQQTDTSWPPTATPDPVEPTPGLERDKYHTDDAGRLYKDDEADTPRDEETLGIP